MSDYRFYYKGSYYVVRHSVRGSKIQRSWTVTQVPTGVDIVQYVTTKAEAIESAKYMLGGIL